MRERERGKLFLARNTRELLSFLVGNPSMKGESRSGTHGERREKREQRRKMRRRGGILRSACKPISISAEIRLSEFPVARGSPRFIGPATDSYEILFASGRKRGHRDDQPLGYFGLYGERGGEGWSASPLLFDALKEASRETRAKVLLAHQKLKKTSVKVSAHVNSANTIQYIIHFTWKTILSLT